MLRTMLLALALTTTALAFAPNAAAECEPNPLNPGYCPGTIGPTIQNARERADDLADRVDDLLTTECEWHEAGIRCE